MEKFKFIPNEFCNPDNSDWSKRKVVDYEAQPAVSLGYDNLLFPFVIIIGGATIAGKSYYTGRPDRISHRK